MWLCNLKCTLPELTRPACTPFLSSETLILVLAISVWKMTHKKSHLWPQPCLGKSVDKNSKIIYLKFVINNMVWNLSSLVIAHLRMPRVLAPLTCKDGNYQALKGILNDVMTNSLLSTLSPAVLSQITMLLCLLVHLPLEFCLLGMIYYRANTSSYLVSQLHFLNCSEELFK